ncbi:MAG: HD domain-containing protein [Armatimonadota bacterium]
MEGKKIITKLENNRPVRLENIKEDLTIISYLIKADEVMNAMGYTEHGLRHANLTSHIAKNILQHLKYTQRDVELAAIAAYMHDIGNCVARTNHSQSGAILTYNLLTRLSMDPEEIASIISAIGNHEEYEGGHPISPIGATVILADKTDVHRTRVTNPEMKNFDIHDRVNYAAMYSFLRVNPEERILKLELTIDTEFASVMEYFEIFLDRMLVCRKAARLLKCEFSLEINKSKLL